MRKEMIRSICLVLLLSCVATAQRFNWTGAGGDNLWDNPANWDSGQVPGPGNEAYIDVPGALAPNGPVIQDGIDATCSGLACEVAGEPTMTITGGTLTVTQWIWWGDGTDSHGTVYMSGGTVTTGSEFELGWGGGEGTWYMTGGTINCPELVIPTGSGRAGQLYLDGGIVNVGSDGLSMTEVGLINITEGTLTLEGDARQVVEGYIADDLITAYDGAGTFEIDYDLTTPGLTTVTAVAPVTEKAYKPVTPTNGQTNVYRDTDLVWIPGLYAAKHDVYLGTVFEDVNSATRADPRDVLVGQNVSTATYDPAGHLELDTTYYWRVDEVNGPPDYTIFKGDVWSFTTEPFVYAVDNIIATSNTTSDAGAGPENTINGSGLNEADEHSTSASDMWLGAPGLDPAYIQYEFDRVYQLHEMLVWNYNVEFELVLGFGIKDATVTYSADGENWTTLADVELGRGTAKSGYSPNTTVAFDGAAAKYVRLTVNSGYGAIPQYGLSEVRFYQIPAHTREPQPASGQTAVDPGVELSWRGGRQAASHEVYFSDDSQAVTEGIALIATIAEDRYSLADLDLQLSRMYYWKVNEVNETETPPVWEGSIWNFTTSDYLVVDDFESYDDEWNAIWGTWKDGYLVDENGSQVGYGEAPFAERTTVHSGRQSMPLAYDNAGAVTYSETDYAFAVSQDWTRAGAATLTLYLYGDPDNAAAQLYVEIDGTRIPYDGDALTSASWTQWSIDLTSLGLDLENVSQLTIGVEGSGAGTVLIDDIRLYRVAP